MCVYSHTRICFLFYLTVLFQEALVHTPVSKHSSIPDIPTLYCYILTLEQKSTHARNFRTQCGCPSTLYHVLHRQLVVHTASVEPAFKKLELFVIWLRYRKKNVKQGGAHRTQRKWNVHGISTTTSRSVKPRDWFSVQSRPLIGGVFIVNQSLG